MDANGGIDVDLNLYTALFCFVFSGIFVNGYKGNYSIALQCFYQESIV